MLLLNLSKILLAETPIPCAAIDKSIDVNSPIKKIVRPISGRSYFDEHK